MFFLGALNAFLAVWNFISLVTVTDPNLAMWCGIAFVINVCAAVLCFSSEDY